MSRVRARCFVASAGAHMLLALLLLAGPGFLGARRAPEMLPVLTFVPDRLVDQMVVGGGSRQGSPNPAPMVAMPEPAPPLAGPPVAAAPPKPVAPASPPKSVSEKEVPTMALKEPKLGGKSLAGAKPSAKREVQPNLKPVVRKPGSSTEARAQREAEAAAWARRVADAQRARISGAVTTLEGKLSGGSLSAVPFGDGGESYANYGLFVLSVYDWAWQPPPEITDESATVKVKVVISREGKVISSEILAKSGLAALDQSVRDALGRVNDIGKPFPEGAKEQQRVFIINFNLKARQRFG